MFMATAVFTYNKHILCSIKIPYNFFMIKKGKHLKRKSMHCFINYFKSDILLTLAIPGITNSVRYFYCIPCNLNFLLVAVSS